MHTADETINKMKRQLTEWEKIFASDKGLIFKIHYRRKWQPTAFSCLENPTNRGAWWAIVHGIPKSLTQQLSTHTHTHTDLKSVRNTKLT